MVFDLRGQYIEVLRLEVRAMVRKADEAGDELRRLVRIPAGWEGRGRHLFSCGFRVTGKGRVGPCAGGDLFDVGGGFRFCQAHGP